ncbi:hypothetical protein JHK87_001841 [Glycine soja]|nr:hypothetical protein JHK87_001841 [Glycine soja]
MPPLNHSTSLKNKKGKKKKRKKEKKRVRKAITNGDEQQEEVPPSSETQPRCPIQNHRRCEREPKQNA